MESRAKTIAHNTVMLYLRMIVVTVITLYTSRVILSVLGEDDFGIFNVAGSLIAFFSIINASLAGSVQRFINFELGKGKDGAFPLAFNAGVMIHLLLSAVILILGETIGLYLFDHYLNIPPDRHNAALWVYHFSLLSTIVTLIAVPYQAYIVASEKMTMFAYLSLVEVVCKLLIVFVLLRVSTDKLIVYAILFFGVTLITNFAFYLYCRLKLTLPRFNRVSLHNPLCKSIFSFSFWNLVGNASNVLFMQGVSLLMNIFYGVAVNAAIGITNQVTNTVSKLIVSFQMAYKPAIVKSFATDDRAFLNNLLIRATKFSFFLLFAACFPLSLNVGYITGLWLETVPPYTNQFIQVLLVSLTLNSLSVPFWNTIEAEGHIKLHQIICAVMQAAAVPVAYLMLKAGFNPVVVMGLNVAVALILVCMRFVMVCNILSISKGDMFVKTLWPILKVVAVSFGLYALYPVHDSIASIAIFGVIGMLAILVLGLDKSERNYITSLIRKKSA